MAWQKRIKNGTVVTAKDTFLADIYVSDGKIAAVTTEELAGEIDEDVDATGKFVFPGFIDTHIHSRDPGPTYKEDFTHSTQAAAAGGITTVFEMPNTNPPVNNAANFDRQHAHLEAQASVDFALWGICLGHLNEMDIAPLDDKGVAAFKFFWGYAVHEETYQLMYNYKPGMEKVIPPFHDGEVYKMMQNVAGTGRVFAVHAENNDLIQTLTGEVEARGGTTYDDLIAGRPQLAEVLTVQAGIDMARATGVRLHILHVSAGESLKRIRAAQNEGLPITVETCPHYLFLAAEDYDTIGAKMKVYPPVKTAADREEIWQHVANGTISHICSDHAPHTEEEKDGSLWEIPAGMCGVETLAPLVLNAASEGKISLNDVARLLAENPARLFGVDDRKGTLVPGTDADLTIVDMLKEAPIQRENLHSKSKVTAYDGFDVKGWPVMTIVRGNTVMQDGDLRETGRGQLVTPGNKGATVYGL
ncbi:allantoinase AllB [Salisediminibacterium halotolerans]|uniref:allantoinase n=1 Tax=Salisediminibacterium halotolerans TaxID=517425 RepID=A0A1H9QKE5_9BACI|nr:allantoinase AllB [Salisediminibacterium haloalkalitolerans]SER60898.1 dihydroorotase [Salisediminibacterium haloalkalitolerans]